jgi:uncharacterized protein (TIGR02996 family)
MGLAVERLTFRGRELLLHSQHLLEPYLRNLPERPDFRRQGLGYSAAWGVLDDHTLWLMSLRTRPDDVSPDPGLRLLFHNEAPVPATWVNQTLRCVDRTHQRFSPIGNDTTHIRQTHLSIWQGMLIAVEELDMQANCRIGGELTSHLERVFGADESAFLRIAFDAPNDSAPRLIYADWLEERNDPRAELIRLADQARTPNADAVHQEQSAFRDRLVRQRGLTLPLWLRLLGYADLTGACP